MEILTNSSLKTFRECPKKYDLHYEQGYERTETPEYFRFGSIWHAGLEAWHKSDRNLEITLAAMLKELGDAPDEFMYAKLMALMEGYHEKYKSEPYESVASEQEFKSPVINPETGRASQLFIYKGIIDNLYSNAIKRIIIKESKTTSDDISLESDYWRKLGMDSQISSYWLGAEALGYKVESILYDVVRKPGIMPLKATPIENRKYKKDGVLYASQRDADETPQEFYERCKAEITPNPDKFYARREVPRSESDLVEHMTDVWLTGQTINSYRKLGKWPRNVNSCMTITHTCEFWRYCSGQASLEDPSLYKKSMQKHRELSPDPVLERVV